MAEFLKTSKKGREVEQEVAALKARLQEDLWAFGN